LLVPCAFNYILPLVEVIVMNKIRVKGAEKGVDYTFFDRDLSWLSFNERVLMEASREAVPLLERIRFLAIYSSNLDEFYRVRIPALKALYTLSQSKKVSIPDTRLDVIHNTILKQLTFFGTIIRQQVLPALKRNNIHLVYQEPVPETIQPFLEEYFMNVVASYMHIVDITERTEYCPENNKIYLAVTVKGSGKDLRVFIVNVPSDKLSRFYSVQHEGTSYIIFLDDIVKLFVGKLFREKQVVSCESFKITRDAELDLEDEFEGNIAKKIEKKISQRDFGLATRFLYEPTMKPATCDLLRDRLGLRTAEAVQGGAYHNLKDLSSIPVHDKALQYPPYRQAQYTITNGQHALLEDITRQDILLHPPFHSYETVLRFFNEAAIDAFVTKIYVTLYRVASDSRIVHALINAARNGKKVMVFVELKARFDEANNIKWAKQMKSAGITIIDSIPGLKVHAKLAVIKKKCAKGYEYNGLLATGNFNESTARFYTDHILFTAHQPMLKEAEDLFLFLKKRRNPKSSDELKFKHLLVGQFNLQQRFIALINREIDHVRTDGKGSITIKLNNLEDQVLISKLYEAARAGVQVTLIVRSICCLVPGIAGMSDTITVKRIVDRYLEHGRVFMFGNGGNTEVYIGSADWMNRNIYRRIEVCFPVYNAQLRSQLIKMLALQVADTVQAVVLDEQMNNIPAQGEYLVRSQEEISNFIVKNQVV
jgi:polyphosphate kinase